MYKDEYNQAREGHPLSVGQHPRKRLEAEKPNPRPAIRFLRREAQDQTQHTMTANFPKFGIVSELPIPCESADKFGAESRFLMEKLSSSQSDGGSHQERHRSAAHVSSPPHAQGRRSIRSGGRSTLPLALRPLHGDGMTSRARSARGALGLTYAPARGHRAGPTLALGHSGQRR